MAIFYFRTRQPGAVPAGHTPRLKHAESAPAKRAHRRDAPQEGPQAHQLANAGESHREAVWDARGSGHGGTVAPAASGPQAGRSDSTGQQRAQFGLLFRRRSRHDRVLRRFVMLLYFFSVCDSIFFLQLIYFAAKAHTIFQRNFKHSNIKKKHFKIPNWLKCFVQMNTISKL